MFFRSIIKRGDLYPATRRRQHRSLFFETLETRWFLASVPFSMSADIVANVDGPVSIFAADLDGDGDSDVLVASSGDNTIAWYANVDGAGTFVLGQNVDNTAAGAHSARAGDIDLDGDLDLLTASADDDTIAWYENTNGAGVFGPSQSITSAAQGASSVYAADLDVLSASYDDDTIAWYENSDGQGAFAAAQPITTTADGASSVFAQDIDGDADMDVVGASSLNDTIWWFENTDGEGGFSSPVAVSSTAGGAASAIALDLDSDGDIDVLGASKSDDTVAWYQNNTIHRSASFFDPGIGIIGPNDFGSRSVSLADVDGDGDLDALYGVTYDSILAWAENTDGAGTFTLHEIDTSTAGPASVELADVDQDGDVDAVVAFVDADTIAWYENTDGEGTFGSKQDIATTQDNPAAVHTVDLDGDGDLDLLAASFVDDTVAWYENLNGAGNFGTAQKITDMADGAIAVYAADIDGDGDADIMVASFYDDTIAWYENSDGEGTFGAKKVITSVADAAISVHAADLDRDGDLDLLAASAFDDTVAWFENLDGAGTFGPENILSTNADGASWVSTADLDRDGDLDVIWSAFVSGDVAWQENLDGSGTFAAEEFASTFSPNVNAFDVGDIDGDGDLDIIPAIYATTTTVWYENRGGQFALPTHNTALPTVIEGRADDILRIDMVHRGRAEDHSEELVALALLLEEVQGDPLTTGEANALVDALDIYRDEGSGEFEPDTDTLVTSLETLDLTNGLQTIPFADGDPNVQVAFASPATFFVVARLTPDATEQPVD